MDNLPIDAAKLISLLQYGKTVLTREELAELIEQAEFKPFKVNG